MIEPVAYFFTELLFRSLCYPIGWPLVKLFTIGKYPTKDSWFSDRPESQWTSVVGLVVLAIAVMTMLGQLVTL